MAKQTAAREAAFEIVNMPLGEIIPYARNPRKNEGAIAKVVASLKEFGPRQPIVCDEDLVVIVGHTRLEAAKRLGWKTFPVHIAHGLSPAQARAYRIADNRTNEEAEWDQELLAVELEDLRDDGFDLAITGFDGDELVELLGAADIGGLRDGADEDSAPEPPDDPITKPGDLIILGSHRLLCGDSTSEADVARLMDGAKADMVFTDPPYGVNYEGGHNEKKRGQIKNDALTGEALTSLFYDSLLQAISSSSDHAAFYIWFASGKSVETFAAFGRLPLQAITNSSKPGQIILDLFSGSGSTLIACEKTGRRAFLMELDPRYCDVIVKRWEDATGNAADRTRRKRG